MKRDEFELLRPSEQKKLADKLYKKVCDEMDEEAMDCEQYYCKGCGHARGRLDHHHIWAKGRGGALPFWYYFQKKNLIHLCRACHVKIHGTYNEQRGLFCYLWCLDVISQLKEEEKNYGLQKAQEYQD